MTSDARTHCVQKQNYVQKLRKHQLGCRRKFFNISIGVHRNDFKKKLKYKKIYIFYERMFLHKIIVKIVSMGVHRNDLKKWNLNWNFFSMKDRFYIKIFWRSYQGRYITSYRNRIKITWKIIYKVHFQFHLNNIVYHQKLIAPFYVFFEDKNHD